MDRRLFIKLLLFVGVSVVVFIGLVGCIVSFLVNS